MWLCAPSGFLIFSICSDYTFRIFHVICRAFFFLINKIADYTISQLKPDCLRLSRLNKIMEVVSTD